MKCGWAVVFCVFVCTPLAAETWTDITGRFQIDAQLKSIEGANVVLLKPNGTTVTVPLEKLSPQSRVQAQEAFAALSPAAAAGPQQALNFTPPEPPPTEPMAAFPEDASLQETVDFILAQVQAGHPEVLWYAIPDEIREAFDSQTLRHGLVEDFKLRPHTNAMNDQLSLRLAELLVTKKTFVLNSKPLQEIGKDYWPMLQESYDPAVGLFYESTRLTSSVLELEETTIEQLVDRHGPRIGGHLKVLLASLPANVLDQIVAGIEVEMHDDHSGTLRITGIPGFANAEFEMVAFQGRWVPQSIAESWPEARERLASGPEQTESDEAVELGKQQTREFDEFSKGMHDMFDELIDPVLAADSQEDFDTALTKLMMTARLFGYGV